MNGQVLSPNFNLAAGQLLVAQKTLDHARWGQDGSVIFILRHDAELTMGVDLTKIHHRYAYDDFVAGAPDMDVLGHLPVAQRRIFRGGAHESGTREIPRLSMTILHDARTGPASAHVIRNRVFAAYSWQGQRDSFASYKDIKPEGRTRLFFGYSYWGPGRLARELESDTGLWVRMWATEDLLFETDHDKLWPLCAAITGIPKTLPEMPVPSKAKFPLSDFPRPA